MPRTLILDIDGTLVDSNDAHARAWVQAFGEQGFTPDFSQVRPLVGMGSDQLVPQLTDVQPGDTRFQPLSDGWQRAFEQEFPQLRAFDGTRELVQTATSCGWKVVVATSGESEMADRLLTLANVADLLPDRVSSQDVKASKPQPDLLEVALKKAGADPAEAWMLGDTRYDVEAAHKAGMKCAVVLLGKNSGLKDADATFADLLAVRDWLQRA
ncbi:HAD family hydrolase [Deinococcus altitudinis]|uniref:HAD family hydrolase n=1 Tax=Deinococcus altitudinis TaxID=468914 RepID=UPI003891E02B